MNKAELLGAEINSTLGLNLYENSRKLEIVDARSIYCYILHKEMNYTLYQVRDSLRAKGKNYDHSTVMHSVKMFEEVRERRKDIGNLRDKIMARSNIKSYLLAKIMGIDSDDKLIEINDCIKNIL